MGIDSLVYCRYARLLQWQYEILATLESIAKSLLATAEFA